MIESSYLVTGIIGVAGIIGIAVVLTLIVIVFIIIKLKSKKSATTNKTTKFSLANIFRHNLGDEFYNELRDTLIKADTGVELTDSIIEKLKAKIKEDNIKSNDEAKAILRDILENIFIDKNLEFDKKTLLFIVGVNGVGKTTSIAKITNYYKDKYSIQLIAADTFRAAAIEQLEEWGSRLDTTVVKGQQGGDPASVLFDGLQKAKAKGTDLVIADTAGRFHNKEHLVNQLNKMKKIAVEKFPEYRFLPLLVLDSNVGQNGLEQAKVFLDNVSVEGTILAKFDATAKGGISFGINKYLELPIYFIGIGEKVENIKEFNRSEFVAKILGM